MKKFLLASILLTAAAHADVGQEQYTINCSACHVLDQMVVGPSLVEVRNIYQNDLDGFLKWCKAPGHKRQGGAQMPSMAHVGDDNLKLIHAHIMKISKDKQEVKGSNQDRFAQYYKNRKAPYVQRLFLPNTGPASIAVFLTEEIAVCWDSTLCRMRYVWNSKDFDGFPHWNGNGATMPNLGGKELYKEENAIEIKGLAKDAPIAFKGYTLKNGHPTFRYNIGDIEILETYTASSDKTSFQRSFQIEGAKDGISLTLGKQIGMKITSDKGNIQDHLLTIDGAPSLQFTLTFSLAQ